MRQIPDDDTSKRNYGVHLPHQIPPTEKKKWPQKPCVMCRSCGVRHDTRYYCKACDVALCKSPCFEEYYFVNVILVEYILKL